MPMMTKQCRHCGGAFVSKVNAAVYCSEACRIPERACKSCGKVFTPRNISKRKAIYCCFLCSVTASRGNERSRGTAAKRQYLYGLSVSQQERMLLTQNERCKICGAPAEHLDHDEGGVRGFLCAKCNIGLGHFRDRPDLLETAADYLRTTSSIVAGRMRLTENVRIQLFDQNGQLQDLREFANSVTTAGKNACADQILAAPTLVKPTHMAVGTGSPAATLLGAEVARVAFTTKTRSGAVVTMVGDFPAGTGTGALTECAVFNVVTANTIDMYLSASFSVVNKGAADSLSISWQLTFA